MLSTWQCGRADTQLELKGAVLDEGGAQNFEAFLKKKTLSPQDFGDASCHL